MFAILMILCGFVVVLEGYPNYKDKIPNGRQVPNPCSPNLTDTYWSGVGHEDIHGKGKRNPFGRDFQRQGKMWTRELCRMDSDGDGRSNGEELGDPDCVWKEGDTPRSSHQLSHPGICDADPTKSGSRENCDSKNSWLNCQPFHCPAFKEEGVKDKEFLIPETGIPTEDDSYYCHGFRLPTDNLYHIIGFEAKVQNHDYVHDITMYGCEDKQDSHFEEHMKLKKCYAGMPACRTPIGVWSSETKGQCFPKEFGLPMGQTGYKHVVVQIHWKNAEKKLGQKDKSGMIMYYTSDLRNNTAQVVRVGQRHLNIPHGKRSVEVRGSCKASCTQLMPTRTTKIANALIRMNKLGVTGKIDLIGKNKQNLLTNNQYKTDEPNLISFRDPVSFHAGDEITVTCSYNAEGTIEPVVYGEEEDKEMCAGFLTIYPVPQNFSICSQWKDLPVCSLDRDLTFKGCDQTTFYRLFNVIGTYCNESCDGLCMVMIRGFIHTKCYRGTLGDFIDEFDVMPNKPLKDKLFPLIKKCIKSSASQSTVTAALISFAAVLASFFSFRRQ